MDLEGVAGKLNERFPESVRAIATEHAGDPYLEIAPPRIAEVCLYLRDDPEMSYEWLMCLSGVGGWVIVAAVLVFSVGEMLASPKSKEYAGRIAPPDKVGMYMGYFYWCVALGNLFGGLLSGVMYQHFGPKGIDRPDIMWVSFAVMGGLTALALGLYNHWIRRRQASD